MFNLVQINEEEHEELNNRLGKFLHIPYEDGYEDSCEGEDIGLKIPFNPNNYTEENYNRLIREYTKNIYTETYFINFFMDVSDYEYACTDNGIRNVYAYISFVTGERNINNISDRDIEQIAKSITERYELIKSLQNS